MAMRRAWMVGLAVAALGVVASAPSATAKGNEGPTTVAALDASVRLRSSVDGARTLVRTVPGGETVLTIDEPLQLRAVDSRERRVALATPLPTGSDPYRPGGRSSTHIVVADLDTGAVRSYDVPRNVEPEAFGVGVGGRDRLYVVDHRPAADPSSYRVGAINLASGTFEGLIGPNKQPLDVDMTGVARKQVLSADGTQLYTLYLQHAHSRSAQPEHAHHDRAPATLAFVHVLDLTAGWAFCVDLPGVGHGPARASSIALGDAGQRVVVTDHHAGKRVSIDTASLGAESLASGGSPDLAVERLAQ